MQIVAISGDQTVDVDFARISERDVRMLESLRGRGAMISVSIEGIPARPAVDTASAKPKKWRWHEVTSARWEMRFDGDRMSFACVKDCGSYWSIQCLEMGGSATTRDYAFDTVERQLRASSYWREGDEIEPYREPVPSLKEWLSERDIDIDSTRVFVTAGFVGLTLANIRRTHAAITEYFEKYPDAEPELRKEWGK